MRSSFGRSPVCVGWGLVVVAGMIVTSSCAKRNEPAPAPTETSAPATDNSEAAPAATSKEDMSKLLVSATTGGGEARYTAIDDIGERAAESNLIVPDLIENLDDSDPQVVWRSERALGDYGEEAVSAAPELRELLSNKDPVLQHHAAVALGRVGDKSEETVDALVTAVGSSDARVSRAAVAALKNLKPGPVKVAQALKKAMTAQDNSVAAQALEAIVELGPKAVPLINEALKDPTTAYLAASAAEEIGPDAAEAVPALVDLLSQTKHSHMQIRVLLALGRIGPGAKSAAPQIAAVMASSQDATVPVAAAFALGSIGSTDADDALRAAVAKDSPFLSMVASWSLAKLHPDDAELKKQAIEKLNAGLNGDDEAIKGAAEKGLKMLETPATTPAQ